MVEMAKANGVNVYHYLTYLLEKLPDDRMSDDELELLVPWNETVKAEIERRANESNQSYVNSLQCKLQNKSVYDRKRKRLIFRYDRKIPDYFSVAGAP